MLAYIKLGDLAVYQTSLKISHKAWNIFQTLNYETKKVIGYQFIRSIDSVAANIAEGYGRYHYLDKIKFYYNSRGSLFEAKHWLWILKVRKIISNQKFEDLFKDLTFFHYQLNKFIKSSNHKNNFK